MEHYFCSSFRSKRFTKLYQRPLHKIETPSVIFLNKMGFVFSTSFFKIMSVLSWCIHIIETFGNKEYYTVEPCVLNFLSHLRWLDNHPTSVSTRHWATHVSRHYHKQTFNKENPFVRKTTINQLSKKENPFVRKSTIYGL